MFPLVLAGLLLSGPAARAEPVRWTLDNGVVALIDADHRAPVVAVVVRHPTGASAAPPGLAHLVEHLLFGPADEAAARVAGIDANAWTDLDALGTWSVGPPGALGAMIAREAGRLAAPLAGRTDADLARERRVVDREQRDLESLPGGLVPRSLAGLLWSPGHPYRPGVLGQAHDRDEYTLMDLREAAWVATPVLGTSLVVMGDVDLVVARALIEGLVGIVPAGRPPVAPGAPAPVAGHEEAWIEDPGARPGLVVSWPTVPSGDPAEPALDLAAELIGARLRARLPPATDLRSWCDNRERGGFLAVQVRGLPPRRAARRLDEVLRELRALAPTAGELARVKGRWSGGVLASGETLVERARIASHCISAGLEVDCLGGLVALRDAVEPGAIVEGARRWLTPEHARSLSLVPRGSRVRPLAGSLPAALP